MNRVISAVHLSTRISPASILAAINTTRRICPVTRCHVNRVPIERAVDLVPKEIAQYVQIVVRLINFLWGAEGRTLVCAGHVHWIVRWVPLCINIEKIAGI